MIKKEEEERKEKKSLKVRKINPNIFFLCLDLGKNPNLM